MSQYINKTNVAILLATFNGETYLRSQLDSILAQTYKDWTVYVHDDGSTDHTLDILNHYAASYPGRFILLADQARGLGPRDNFMHLLSQVEAHIYMFCDQDDIWYPEKTALSVSELTRISHPDNPALVYTNLKLGDANENILSESFWASINHNPSEQDSLQDMAYSNYITGCTMCFNDAAKQVAFPTPSWAPMHDWWVAAMVYRHNGNVSHIATPTMMYRKHGGNATGNFVETQKGKGLLLRLHEMWQQYTLMRNVGAISGFIAYLRYKKSRK